MNSRLMFCQFYSEYYICCRVGKEIMFAWLTAIFIFLKKKDKKDKKSLVPVPAALLIELLCYYKFFLKISDLDVKQLNVNFNFWWNKFSINSFSLFFQLVIRVLNFYFLQDFLLKVKCLQSWSDFSLKSWANLCP